MGETEVFRDQAGDRNNMRNEGKRKKEKRTSNDRIRKGTANS